MSNLDRLIDLARGVSDAELAPAVDFLELIAARQARRAGELDAESRAWEAAGAADMAAGIAAAEAQVPPDALSEWLQAVDAASTPAHYLPGKGLIVGDE